MGEYWICPNCGHALEGVSAIAIRDDLVDRFNELADQGLTLREIMHTIEEEGK